jgi:multicomponent Na+:H+ antiporter subunit G
MSVVQIILSIALLVLSWGFILFGMVSIFRLKNIYTRILSASTIDSVGSLTIILALLVANITHYEYVLRFVLLIGFLLITNPISSHVNIRSAYLTGVDVKHLKRLGHDEPLDKGGADGYRSFD